jgi:SSS family solute:Na+ symporter
MLVLVGGVYYSMGGVTSAHQSLTDLADMVPSKLQAIGHRGWTAMPEFGFGEVKYNLWWIMVSTIILGVGIGVLAQPQLAVRFMTVKSRRELNRAVMIGGIFILLMTGGAFTVGSLSNAWFTQHGPELEGQVTHVISEEKGHAVIEWTVTNAEGKEEIKNAPVVLSEGTAALGESVKGRSISVVYAKGNSDQIIPLFINQAMPAWFRLLFLLTLLAAAMSTLSSQFHTLGTAISRDVYGQLLPKGGQGIGITRLGILVGIVLAVVISYYNRGGGYFIARATAIFFGLCVSTFLPAYLGGLFTKWVSRPAAIASMIVGFLVTAFWLTFVKSAEAGVIGLVQKVTDGKTSLLESHLNWPNVDPIVIALPLSIITVVIFSLIFRPKDELKSLEGMPS